MAKNIKAIVIPIVFGAVITTAIILLHRKFKRPKSYTLDAIAKFISNPEKLSSPDLADSWQKVNPELLHKLKELSRMYGSKLTITSGYRTASHNASVGGVSKNSAHLTGNAVDISTGNYANSIRMGLLAKSLGFQRFGIGNTFIHLDIDPQLLAKTGTAVWTYQGVSDPQATADLNLT